MRPRTKASKKHFEFEEQLGLGPTERIPTSHSTTLLTAIIATINTRPCRVLLTTMPGLARLRVEQGVFRFTHRSTARFLTNLKRRPCLRPMREPMLTWDPVVVA